LCAAAPSSRQTLQPDGASGMQGSKSVLVPAPAERDAPAARIGAKSIRTSLGCRPTIDQYLGDFHAKRGVRLRRDTQTGARGLSVPTRGYARNVCPGAGYASPRWHVRRDLLRLVWQDRHRCRELSSQPEYRHDLRGEMNAVTRR